MVLTIYEVFKINRVLEKLINQQLDYQINVAYKLSKLKQQLDEIESYAFERFMLMFPQADIGNLNENESEVYKAILSSNVEIDNFNLTENEVFLNDSVKLTIEDVTIIRLLFEKRENK